MNPQYATISREVFSQADIDNIKWYPPVPAALEQMEGMILDKVKATKQPSQRGRAAVLSDPAFFW